jgi:hypothetical protein
VWGYLQLIEPEPTKKPSSILVYGQNSVTAWVNTRAVIFEHYIECSVWGYFRLIEPEPTKKPALQVSSDKAIKNIKRVTLR